MHEYREIITAVDMAEAEHLLVGAGLRLPDGHTFGLGFYEDNSLVACGFLAGDILCGICVDTKAQEGGIATGILSRLVLHARSEGKEHFFIFTKAKETWKFKAAGFELVAKTADTALLEQGSPTYADWLDGVRRRITAHGWDTVPHPTGGSPQGNVGAIVMNANPFTLGHNYLARTAAKSCARVLVFVVEEEASVFPFDVRFDLVRRGLADVDSLLVLPAGPYMVSRASFPAYFTADAERGAVHAALDCTIFGSRIAADLGIGQRFVGSEPFDPVSAAYNTVMASVLEQYGLKVREIPRLETSAGAISASTVRKLLQGDTSEKSLHGLSAYLPAVTLEYLHEKGGIALRQKLQKYTKRH